MKRLTLLVCLVAIPIAIFANAHEPYQGNFDLDGDVDFADFLTFASNYGKTGGSTTPSNRVDTVRVVVRDTIYIDSGSGGNTGNGSGGNTGGGGNQGTQTDSLDVPTGLDSIEFTAYVFSESSTLNLSVNYLDNAESKIQKYGKIWRNPDKITVIISRYGEEVYRSNNVKYERKMHLSDTQSGIIIFISSSEIPRHFADMLRLYDTEFGNVFQIRVTVEFDGVEYTALAKYYGRILGPGKRAIVRG